jgi:hypothetical protein
LYKIKGVFEMEKKSKTKKKDFKVIVTYENQPSEKALNDYAKFIIELYNEHKLKKVGAS